MIRALYVRALALGIAGLVLTLLGLAGVMDLLTQSFEWNRLFLISLVVVWAFSGVMFIVRARPRVIVSPGEMRQLGIGGWTLKVDEIEAVSCDQSAVVIQPSSVALTRQAVRSSVQWSRIFGAGQRVPGAIVLPRPHLDAVAKSALEGYRVTSG